MYIMNPLLEPAAADLMLACCNKTRHAPLLSGCLLWQFSSKRRRGKDYQGVQQQAVTCENAWTAWKNTARLIGQHWETGKAEHCLLIGMRLEQGEGCGVSI